MGFSTAPAVVVSTIKTAITAMVMFRQIATIMPVHKILILKDIKDYHHVR